MITDKYSRWYLANTRSGHSTVKYPQLDPPTWLSLDPPLRAQPSLEYLDPLPAAMRLTLVLPSAIHIIKEPNRWSITTIIIYLLKQRLKHIFHAQKSLLLAIVVSLAHDSAVSKAALLTHFAWASSMVVPTSSRWWSLTGRKTISIPYLCVWASTLMQFQFKILSTTNFLSIMLWQVRWGGDSHSEVGPPSGWA